MTRLSELSVTDRYRAVAATFSARVNGTRDWEAPSPVAEWTARDVVGHLTSWFPPMLTGGSGVTLTPGPPASDDPAGAWQSLDRQVQALLDDPATAELTHTNVHTGTQPIPAMVDRYFTVDVFLHTWDLARASGHDDRLDEGFVEELFEGMSGIADIIRGSGQFGQQQAVPEDATSQDRLMAFIGRDPRWSPVR